MTSLVFSPIEEKAMPHKLQKTVANIARAVKRLTGMPSHKIKKAHKKWKY